ncbi:pentatricopeptide repeat-containing protein At4g02750 isoform X4 [Ricinus communis]|uniref:pentatricopeptide repeat-containing protein At4g02750 isoform X4 n=1 Tax=Ricinus communis TaxID=3988 RepID=UPI00201AA7E8|nr:pentatricopeptide repeat-containing protein At4g02750 isoform X4 [Ricinus communis]
MKRRLISIGDQSSYAFKQNLRITHLGKCGRIEDAIRIFLGMSQRNTVTYNSMISAYAKNGRVIDARVLFDKMPCRNLVSWNTMIAGYLHNNKVDEAYELFVKMPRRDLFSWTLMITCYTQNGMLEKAKQLLNSLPCNYKKDAACWNAMISGYSREGRYDDAKRLFNEMPVKNIVSWNSMLAGYTQNGQMSLALQLFHEMLERDVVSWNLMVDGFVELGDLDSAWEFFKKVPEPNIVSWVTMLYGFARKGKLLEARRLFDQMPSKNVVSWNAMISAYVQSRQIDEAEKLFEEMPKRDSVSWTTMINGYVRAGYTQCGRVDEAIHLFEQMVKKDIVSWNTMVAAYAQVGQMERALKVFKEMGERNLVSWNSLISGFMLHGMYLDALWCFVLMQHEGKKPDQSTFACALSSCAIVAALQVGRQLHHLVIKSGYINDLFVCNALITMYAKCGKILEAKLVFKGICNADVVSWNSLIGGYALNGCGEEALTLFEEMKLAGVVPDQVTFIGILSACSHAGLIDQGLELFHCMTQVYGIESLAEHYACIVDLLGRAGRLDEAFEMVKRMKIKSNAGVWGALLGACRMHRNLELGKFAAQKLLKFEPNSTSHYVLLSNMHAEAGRWSEVQEVRLIMKEISTRKLPGCSWVELKNQVHTFLSDNLTWSTSADIHETLQTLTAQMRNTVRMFEISV